MRFSRNPSGVLEVYTDEGIYVGTMSTMNESAELTANDGGPGSGNWGHSGRPGLVGGSGPGGGGKQYRGGRSDIGYFNSRKDWLNGLSGEKQDKAARFIKTATRVKNEFGQKKEVETKRLERLWKDGLLTKHEVDERIKQSNFDKYDPDMTPEAYIMKVDTSLDDRKALLGMVGEARTWAERGGKLQEENLTEEELKALDTFVFNFDLKNGKDGEAYLTDDEMKNRNLDRVYDELSEDAKKFYLDMKAKACGIPNSGTPIEDHVEKIEKEFAPEKKDFDWFGPDCGLAGWERHTHFPRIIQIVAGKRTDEVDELNTNEDIEAALQEMVNSISVKEKPSLRLADDALNLVAKAKGIPWRNELKEAVKNGKQIDGLTREETDELVEILKKKDDEDEIDTHPDWVESMKVMVEYGSQYNEDNRRYAMLKAKALGLPEAESKEVIEQKETERKAAEKQKRDDFVKNGRNRFALYDNAGDIGKIKELLTSSGMFRKDAKVNLFGVDIYCARKAAIYADKFVQRFPFLYGQLGGLDNQESGTVTYASCKRLYGYGKVSLNNTQKFFGNESSVISNYNEDVRTGFHPIGTTYEATYTHEFAHALGGWLTLHKVNGSEDGTEGMQFESKLRLSVLKKLKLTKAAVEQELSRYAQKDSYEWFAEAMAEALHSPSPRPMATECLRQLEEILQKEGLIDGPIQRIL